MQNILFYGNCQTTAIKETLCLHSDQFQIFNVHCWNNNYDKETFTNIINNSDIIITQSIQDNYRDVEYLSTSYIINNAKQNCKIILFDSCYFDFYYFDLTYKQFNNDVLHIPSDYHYNKMIECYCNNINYIENYVNNIELKTSEELDKIANDSLNELQKRYNMNREKYNENIFIISIYDFVKTNYKNKLLFYSMNHPTKYVIQYICEEIIKHLNILNTINYNIDVLNDPKCIIYKCIQKNVNFNIDEHLPLLANKTNVEEITQLYFDTYRNIKLQS